MGWSTLFCGAGAMIRLLITLLLAALAVFAQLEAAAPLLPGWRGTSVSWPVLLGWQALAALAAALCFACCMSGKSRRYRREVFVHAFCLSLFLPVAGQILFLCMVLAPAIFPVDGRGAESQALEAPRFIPSLASHVSYGAGARLRVRLSNRSALDEDRVGAMVAMRSLPLSVTGGMLHDLLSDPLEEIRLLAYGIPNAAENLIMQRILAVSRRRDMAATDGEKSLLSSELAELHWELIHQNLAQGELRRHALERVERYARSALALDENNAAMWYLLGRCALLDGRPQQAEVFLEHAQVRRFPAQRLLPWLAEAAFMQREYSRIGPIIEPLRDGILPPALQASVRYWTT